MLGQTFASLENSNFRLFWTGQSVSLLGTWMQVVGQSWLVLELTHSPVALGLASALQYTPMLLTVLFAGVLVDRLPKHRLLLTTQTLMLVQAAALAILVISGRIEVWHVYVLATAFGFLNAFDQPTRQAFAVELVGREHVVNAVGLTSAQVNSAKLVGPAIGGLVIAHWGVGACFGINAISFLAMLTSLLLLRRGYLRPTPRLTVRAPILTDLIDGWRFLLSQPDLTTAIILLLGLGPFIYSTSSIIPLIAQDALHVGASEFGLMVAAVGFGSLSVSLAIAMRAQSNVGAILRSASAFAILYMMLAFVPSYLAALVVLVLLGVALQSFGTLTSSLLQLGTPDRLRGRAMSVFTLLTNGITPLGALFMGFASAWRGVRFTLEAEASLCVIAVIMALLYRLRLNGRAPAPVPVRAREG